MADVKDGNDSGGVSSKETVVLGVYPQREYYLTLKPSEGKDPCN